MFKKITALITLLCFILCVGGCYTRRQIPPEQLTQYPKYTISKVITTNEDTIKFSHMKGKCVIKEDRIEGFLRDSTFRSIPLSEVKTIHIQKLKTGKTILVVTGVTIFGLGGLAFLCWALAAGT